jgi:hypothetical protein
MATTRTGTVEKTRGATGIYYRGKIRLKDGTRVRVEIPECKNRNKERAREYVGWAQEREDRTHELYTARALQAAKVTEVESSDEGDAWFDA